MWNCGSDSHMRTTNCHRFEALRNKIKKQAQTNGDLVEASVAQQNKIARLVADKDLAVEALKIAYMKVHLSNPELGYDESKLSWGELQDRLCDAICNVIGDKAFQKMLGDPLE